MPTSLSHSFPFVPVETKPDVYLVGKELVILLFECVVGKRFVVFYVFSFLPAVYVGTLNLITSIPGPSILTFIKEQCSRFITINRLVLTWANRVRTAAVRMELKADCNLKIYIP